MWITCVSLDSCSGMQRHCNAVSLHPADHFMLHEICVVHRSVLCLHLHPLHLRSLVHENRGQISYSCDFPGGSVLKGPRIACTPRLCVSFVYAFLPHLCEVFTIFCAIHWVIKHSAESYRNENLRAFWLGVLDALKLSCSESPCHNCRLS